MERYYDFQERWYCQQDMNRDGAFTISDVGDMFFYVLYAPGDGIIYLLSTSDSARTFFEMTPDSYYSGWSLMLSILGWLIALIMLGVISGG